MPDAAPPAPNPIDPPETAKRDARKCFEHALKAAESKNYDYAIELYLQGLALWPGAIEDGLKRLRVTGVARRQSGKKAPGFLEVRKYPTTGKDARKNLLNAYHLFALDPTHSQYLEAVLLSALQIGLHYVVHWIAPILWESLSRETKLSAARVANIYRAVEEAGDRLNEFGDLRAAEETLRIALHLADRWRAMTPDNSDANKAVSSASSKLTIVQGRFGTDEDFRSSLKDAAAQRDLHDQQRTVQQDVRLSELIAKAGAAYEADPNTALKLTNLVDLLLRTEDDAREQEAVRLLDEAYARSGDYTLKFKADDVRIRRLRRQVRAAVDARDARPGDEAARATADDLRRRQVETELAIIEERIRQYPTDLRLRYELGVRLFEMGRFDEAIPAFQLAQAEVRRRDAARLYIGRCFFEKQFWEQASGVLSSAVAEHEIQDDDVGKGLRYWLARTLEATGKPNEAARVYGQLIQFDYNYRDARQRFERLSLGS